MAEGSITHAPAAVQWRRRRGPAGHARRSVGELTNLLRSTRGGRNRLRVLPRDVRVVRGLVRQVRSGAVDEPPERRFGGVSALSRAV